MEFSILCGEIQVHSLLTYSNTFYFDSFIRSIMKRICSYSNTFYFDPFIWSIMKMIYTYSNTFHFDPFMWSNRKRWSSRIVNRIWSWRSFSQNMIVVECDLLVHEIMGNRRNCGISVSFWSSQFYILNIPVTTCLIFLGSA